MHGQRSGPWGCLGQFRNVMSAGLYGSWGGSNPTQGASRTFLAMSLQFKELLKHIIHLNFINEPTAYPFLSVQLDHYLGVLQVFEEIELSLCINCMLIGPPTKIFNLISNNKRTMIMYMIKEPPCEQEILKKLLQSPLLFSTLLDILSWRIIGKYTFFILNLVLSALANYIM